MILPSELEMHKAFQLLQQKQLSSSVTAYDDFYIKYEAALPGGSYKMRGVEFFAAQCQQIKTIPVLSAGNLALAAAIRLQANHIQCEAIVPDGISQIKRDKLAERGATLTEKPFHEIWNIVQRHDLRQSTTFLHPFNSFLLAGYASIILELEQEGFTKSALIVPFGLGGLAVALAHAIETFDLNIDLYLCEITQAAPFKRALQATHPVLGEKLQSFIEAMGTPIVLDDVFDYLQPRIADVVTVEEADVKEEIYRALQNGVQIEGAAGAALAAARQLVVDRPKIALMTGANISEAVLETIKCQSKGYNMN